MPNVPQGAGTGATRVPAPTIPTGAYSRFANPFSGDWANGRNLDYLNSTPDAAYALFTQLFQGPGGIRNWLRGQYSNLWGQYSGALSADPTLTWVDYLANQNLGNMYGSQSPSARGENPNIFAPRLRYIGF